MMSLKRRLVRRIPNSVTGFNTMLSGARWFGKFLGALGLIENIIMMGSPVLSMALSLTRRAQLYFFSPCECRFYRLRCHH